MNAATTAVMTAKREYSNAPAIGRAWTSPGCVGWGSSRDRGEGRGRPGVTTGSGSPPGPSPLHRPAQRCADAASRDLTSRAAPRGALRPHPSPRRTA